MHNSLSDLLNELDNHNLEEQKDHEIWMKIHKISVDLPSREAEMEKMAFYISEVKGMHVKSEWDFFYPHILNNDTKGLIEYPQLNDINEDTISYWKQRYKQTNNLFMKLRYMGLVLVFENKVLRKKNPQLAYLYIKILIDATKKIKGCSQDLIRYASRALSLSKSLKNSELIEESILNLINLEDKIAVTDLASTWGFCFEILLLGKEKKLTEQQKEKILKDMEDKFFSLSEQVGVPSYLLLHTLEPLTAYYRSIKDFEKIEYILKVYSTKVKKYLESVRPIIVSVELTNLHKLLVKNHQHREAENVLVLLNKNSSRVREDMSVLEIQQEISHKDMDEILRINTVENFDETLKKLIYNYVISKKNAIDSLEIRNANFPFLNVASGRTIIDENGRIKQIIDANSNDYESLIIKEMLNIIQMNTFSFNILLRELIKKNEKSCEDLVDIIYKSPVFKLDNREIIYKGIEAFLKDDHIVCIHLLIPQIEIAFKKIIELQSGNTLQKNKFQGMNFQTLDSLVKNELIRNIYDDDSIFYFRVILCDQRGFNIRNDVCHGIINANQFDTDYSLLVIHIVLLLSQIRDDKFPNS